VAALLDWLKQAAMSRPDPFNLQRFVEAQRGVYEQALAEIAAGRKRSHWMWFIFPQIAGLGHSSMAQRYAISSVREAEAYLKHPVLGPRLRECANLVAQVDGKSAYEILGSPDDMKFHSCMTLFARAAPQAEIFEAALDKYFDGRDDALTLARL
jgi:uncharacterized protein (DUF1810 family)